LRPTNGQKLKMYKQTTRKGNNIMQQVNIEDLLKIIGELTVENRVFRHQLAEQAAVLEAVKKEPEKDKASEVRE